MLLLTLLLSFLPTINCQLSHAKRLPQARTVNCQLSTINCQLSTVNCQLSTVNCQLLRPYSVGYNFQVAIDSIAAQSDDPLLMVDSVRTHSLMRGQTLVVAQFQTVPTDTIDSVWVQVGTYVAEDSTGLGPHAELVWMRESELMESVVPDLAVSKAIHAITLRAYLWRVVTLGFLLFLFLSRFLQHFDTSVPVDSKTQKLKNSKTQKLKNSKTQKPIMLLAPLPTVYPTLLTVVAAIATTLSMNIPQGEWIEYYFNPTVNPFSATSTTITAVLALIWLALILLITTITEAFRLLPLGRAAIYICSVPGVCTLVIWLLSQDMPTALTWTLCAAIIIALAVDYLRRIRTCYTCGQCGAPLRTLGTCPRCGAENKTD